MDADRLVSLFEGIMDGLDHSVERIVALENRLENVEQIISFTEEEFF